MKNSQSKGFPLSQEIFGLMNPEDDVYNALLGAYDIPLNYKLFVLSAIHDSIYGETSVSILSGEDSQRICREVKKIVDDAIKAKPDIVIKTLNKWLNELKENISKEE